MALEIKNSEIITWYVDAAFAVHSDMKSHTGATMTLENGFVASYSLKQKVNSRSSTEAELIGIDDVVTKILWTRKFLQNQGLIVKHNIVFRDNTSAMKLEENGRMSAGKRTRRFDIKSDLVKRKELEIKYCPTLFYISRSKVKYECTTNVRGKSQIRTLFYISRSIHKEIQSRQWYATL